MDVARPYTAICSSLDGDVLHVLAGTNRPLTGRELSRLVGRSSHAGVRDVLNRLAEHGLVNRQEAGRAFLFTLNREHLAAPAVSILSDMRSEFLRRVRTLIEHWEVPPIHASIFGSAARADGDTQSDIDIFIVRPEGVHDTDPVWREQLYDLATSVHRWTGNHAGVVEIMEKDVSPMRETESPIAIALQNDAILLSGSPVSALLDPTP
jgi:predicted nucleotidyltransferase